MELARLFFLDNFGQILRLFIVTFDFDSVFWHIFSTLPLVYSNLLLLNTWEYKPSFRESDAALSFVCKQNILRWNVSGSAEVAQSISGIGRANLQKGRKEVFKVCDTKMGMN